MCNLGQAISQMFGGSSGGENGAFMQSEAQAQTAATSAETALTTAINDATQASLPVADNPSALAASKAQQAKLLAAQGAAWSFGSTPSAAPAVATKVLFGA